MSRGYIRVKHLVIYKREDNFLYCFCSEVIASLLYIICIMSPILSINYILMFVKVMFCLVAIFCVIKVCYVSFSNIMFLIQ